MKPRSIILLVLAVLVFGYYGYRVYDFKQEMKERRADHDDAFIEQLSLYDFPTSESWRLTEKAFREKNFKELERLAVRYGANTDDPGNGIPDITRYYSALAHVSDDGMRWESVFARTKEWRDQYPKSNVVRIAQAPEYVHIHLTAAHFSTPSWGGKPGEWERNLRQAIKDLPKEKSDEVYADTIYRMVRRGHGYGQSFLDTMKAANIDKAKLKRGLISLSQKDGDGVYYNSALAHFALRHKNDAKACRDALEKAGWKIDPRIWMSEKNFNVVCRTWLKGWFKAYADNSDEYESKMSPLRFFGG